MLEDRLRDLFPWKVLSIPVTWAKEAERVVLTQFSIRGKRPWGGKCQGVSEL